MKFWQRLPLLFGSCSPVLAEKPNVIVIPTVDIGFSDLGCFGSEIETPHLDSLAENGWRFPIGRRAFPARGDSATTTAM